MYTIKILEAMATEIELIFKDIVGEDVEFIHSKNKGYTCKLCGNKHIGIFAVNKIPVYVCPSKGKMIIRVFGSIPGLKVDNSGVVKAKTYKSGWTILSVIVPTTDVFTPRTQCEALTKRGIRCKNTSQKGFRLCGPHLDALKDGLVVSIKSHNHVK